MASSATVTGVQLTDSKLFRQSCYVDGAWVNARGGATINVDNPATGEIVGTVPKFGAAETRDAIEAANRAFPEWRKKTAKERAAALRRWFAIIRSNQRRITAARSFAGLRRHAGNSRAAAAIAARVSARPSFGTVPMVSPVAGLSTSIEPWPASTHAPSM